MLPSMFIEDIQKQINELYSGMGLVTIGLLVADARQNEAKQYILNYLNMFDLHSGKYIDFFIPGYYTDSENVNCNRRLRYHPTSTASSININDNPVFTLERTGAKYYFDSNLFEKFIENMRSSLGIKYTYNPMLILVEIDLTKWRGEIAYQKKMIIELDDNTNIGIRRSGMLFDRIFELAKETVNLNRYRNQVRMYYIKGAVVERLIKFLEGDWIETIADTAGDILKFRVKQ